MKTISATRRTLCSTLSAALLAGLCAMPAQASGTDSTTTTGWIFDRICKLQFEHAQRIDMESFRDYDADTFRAVHHEDAVSIFTGGTTLRGIDAIMAALAGHFSGREAIWEWTEIERNVYGCNTAYILYETRYSIPRIGLMIHARTGVAYTYHRGMWLAVSDQGTLLPAAP